MTDDRSLDRALERAARSWIDGGPTRAPDRPVEAALSLIQTTNQERDLRIPWRVPTMNPLARLAAVAVVVVLATGVALLTLRPGGNVGTPAPSTSPTVSLSPSPNPSPTPAPTVAGSAAASTVLDTRTIADDFALPMKVTLPVGWQSFHDITGALGLVNTGSPEGPDSTWWGPDFLLVDDAQIHDPSTVVSSMPANPDRSRFVPWPADFFEYITGLPGVTVVSGPEPITIGGVTGTQITVMTPPMHPLVWMEGDYSWLGGGRTGVDDAAERRFAVLEAGGHTLFISLANDPSTFEARNTEFQPILDSITFE